LVYEYFEELSSLPVGLLSPGTIIMNAQFLCYWLLLSVITLEQFFCLNANKVEQLAAGLTPFS
jgi:hypothetical protein